MYGTLYKGVISRYSSLAAELMVDIQMKRRPEVQRVQMILADCINSGTWKRGRGNTSGDTSNGCGT